MKTKTLKTIHRGGRPRYHDSDPKHISKLAKRFSKQEDVNVMQWPVQSPDLNPIKNVWEIVNRQVNRESAHRDLNKLYQTINKAWSDIPLNIIENLISSIPKRCSEGLKNRNYATKYQILLHNLV